MAIDLDLRLLLLIAAAAIVVLHAMIFGLRLHHFLARHTPGLAAWIPRDGAVLLGLLAGIGSVALWLR